MQKQNLLVLLGAGSGIEIGMPSTSEITEKTSQLENPVIEITPGYEINGLEINGDKMSLIKYLWNHMKGYYKNPDFERLIHTLESLNSLMRSSDSRTHDNYKISLGPFISIPAKTFPTLSSSIRFSLDEIYRTIFSMIYEKCSNLSQNLNNDFIWYKDFWNKINSISTPKIVTINYDECIRKVLPDLDNGYEEIDNLHGLFRFNPKSFIEYLQKKPLVINLHGSIHLGYFPNKYRGKKVAKPKEFIMENLWDDLYYFEKPDEALKTWEQGGRSHHTNQAGEDARIGPIITGLHKTDKLVALPYSFYYSGIYNLLFECDKIIIIGYSFSDIHINSWLSRITQMKGNKRKIMYITKSNGSDYLYPRYKLMEINDNFQTIITLGYGWDNLNDPTKQGPFAFSDDNCCAIWFDGFKSFAELGFEQVLKFLKLD